MDTNKIRQIDIRHGPEKDQHNAILRKCMQIDKTLENWQHAQKLTTQPNIENKCK